MHLLYNFGHAVNSWFKKWLRAAWPFTTFLCGRGYQRQLKLMSDEGTQGEAPVQGEVGPKISLNPTFGAFRDRQRSSCFRMCSVKRYDSDPWSTSKRVIDGFTNFRVNQSSLDWCISSPTCTSLRFVFFLAFQGKTWPNTQPAAMSSMLRSFRWGWPNLHGRVVGFGLCPLEDMLSRRVEALVVWLFDFFVKQILCWRGLDLLAILAAFWIRHTWMILNEFPCDVSLCIQVQITKEMVL